jgi:hypothetical protein
MFLSGQAPAPIALGQNATIEIIPEWSRSGTT